MRDEMTTRRRFQTRKLRESEGKGNAPPAAHAETMNDCEIEKQTGRPLLSSPRHAGMLHYITWPAGCENAPFLQWSVGYLVWCAAFAIYKLPFHATSHR